MKTLICQIWKTLKDEEQGLVSSSYSLHLNEKSRIQYIHKNLRKIQKNGAVDAKTHFSCEVEEDVYEEVLKGQIKHGLMFEGEAPCKPKKKRFASWAPSDMEMENANGVMWKNITIQFQELNNVMKKMEIIQNDPGIQNAFEELIEELNTDSSH